MDQWVDERLASLEPSTNFESNADRALEGLRARKPSANPKWMRFAMTATIVATTGAIVLMLPWQGFWKSKDPAAPKPAAIAVKPQQQTEPAKPPEKPQEAPAPQAKTEPEKEVQQRQEAQQAQPQRTDRLLDLPNNEADLRAYLEQLAAARSVAAQNASVETEPTLIRNVTPGYSDEGRKARIQGTIEMVVTVKTDGTVQFEKYVTALGYGLDERAREAVEHWQFRPAMKDGVPVPKMINVTVNFSLR